MNGFFHYFLSALDPMANLGFSPSLSRADDVSANSEWWLFFVLPFVIVSTSLDRYAGSSIW